MINTILMILNTFIMIGVIIIDVLSMKSNRHINKMLKDDIKVRQDFIDSANDLIIASQNKSTAQDNLLWRSIIILAKRIHELEDNRYV